MGSHLGADARGFTLIEVLVALFIVVVGMTGLARVLISGQEQSVSNVRETQLMNVADQQIEQVRALVNQAGFANLVMMPTSSTGSQVPVSSNSVAGHTWASPTGFVEGGGTVSASSSSCGVTGSGYEVASNYDNVNTAAGAGPYGTAPIGYVQWSGCPTDTEPLETVAYNSSWPAIVQEPSATPACSTSSATIYTPCTVALNNGSFSTTVTVYTFVTDSFDGVSVSGVCTASGSIACPSVSATSGCTVSVSTPACGTVSGCTNGSFPSSAGVSTPYSTPCADVRRVTVAVVPSGSAATGRVTPVYTSTEFADPAPTQNQENPIGFTLVLEL